LRRTLRDKRGREIKRREAEEERKQIHVRDREANKKMEGRNEQRGKQD
jgi:hypothetical protein